MRLFVIMLWNIFVIGGCAYLVFWKGASWWLFVLAYLILYDCPIYKKQIYPPPPPPAKPTNPPRSR